MKTKSLRAALLFGFLIGVWRAAPAAAQVVASFPVSVTNTQSVGSAATLQQPVTWNPSLFAPYESADLGNIRFCADSACATPLYAWLEACSPNCSPTASTATAWVQLTSAVPATAASIIYMAFLPTSSDFDGNYWGESIDVAPGFDNGANVFTYYNNGQSTTTAAGLSAFTVANGGSLNTTVLANPLNVSTNVIVMTGNGSTANSSETVGWYNTGVVGDNFVIEGWVSMAANENALFAVRGGTAASLSNYLLGDGWTGDFASVVEQSGSGNNTLLYGAGARVVDWFWSYGAVSGTTLTNTIYSQPLELGGTVEATASGTNAAFSSTNTFIGVATWAGSNAAAYFYQWRVRAYPPAGVQPIAYVAPRCYGVILANSNTTTATPVPYQQSLTFSPTTYATLEASNLGNIRYCADSQCQTPLYAWLGGCNGAGNGACSPTSSSATVWVQLASAIPAAGTQTIYQCFMSKTANFDGVFWGESIDIGSGGDNGSNVFTYYNNGQSVAGMTVTTGGTLATAAVANPYGTTTNIIELTSRNAGTSNETVGWVNNAVAGDNMVIEGWVNRNTNQSAAFAARGASAAATSLTNYLLGEGWAAAANATLYYEANATNTPLAANGTYPAAAGWLWSYGVITGTALTNAIYSKQPELGGVQAASTTVSNAVLGSADQYVGIADGALTGNAKIAKFYQWRVRVYFPGSTAGVADSTAPAAVSNLAAAGIATSSAALSWTAPTDANVPSVFSSISEYAVQYASYTAGVVWSTANAQVMISTSGVTAGAAQGAFVTGLNANTTYYFYIWSQDPGLLWSPLSNGATMVTLANPINAAGGVPVSITASSVTVHWSALPTTPSSSTGEGYELDVSTTNFQSGTVYSSATASDLASTLAVAGLNTGTTMYFRVGTLNWVGALNYVSLSSANIQISPSIATLVMGLDSNVAFSTVSVSSVVVTNAGNLPLTLVVSGSTITAGSPWVLSVSSSVEAPVLQGEWSSTQPTSASFNTPITNAPVSSTAGGNYAGGQSGQAVPSGASVTMWFKFWAPTSTAAGNTQEVIQVLYQAVYP